MKKDSSCLIRFGEFHVLRLRRSGRYSTAHVYRCALRSLSLFCGGRLPFRLVTPDFLDRYSRHLLRLGLKPNTVSTYMRMLRSVYNLGVASGLARPSSHLFRGVYTGVDTRHKRSIPLSELHRLLYSDPGSARLRRVQSVASLLFSLCGMPFVDLAHLERNSLNGGILRYHRVKTLSAVSVAVPPPAVAVMGPLLNVRRPLPGRPDYLLSILSGRHARGCEASYKEYQSALRSFNRGLKSLASSLGLSVSVSSYTLRHSWATVAKRRGVPVEMISESLGHRSLRTTQIYLRSFSVEERGQVNLSNIRYVMNYRG